MNVVNFNDKACERIQRYFDSYLDNELLVETNHEVLRHLQSCAGCSKVLETRARLKDAVKQAVLSEEVPAFLLESVQNEVRRTARRRGIFGSDFGRWTLAAAAALVFVAGSFLVLRESTFSPVASRTRDTIEFISVKAQELMRVGLVDHVHCALLSGRWKRFVSFEEMEQATGRTALGPEFIGLVPMVKEKLGAKFQLVQGHKCNANHRQYVHLILTGEQGAILSLVITEKNGEEFTRGDIAATLEASGVPLYRTRQGQLEIAGFETNRYLAYVVSNLPKDANLQVASTLAPPVSDYLQKL